MSPLLENEKLGLAFLRLLSDMLPRSLRAAGNAWIAGGWESFAAVSGWPNVLDGAESRLDTGSLIMYFEEGEKIMVRAKIREESSNTAMAAESRAIFGNFDVWARKYRQPARTNPRFLDPFAY